MNNFASTQNSSAQLQDYYDSSGTTITTPTREALKRRRKKQAEKIGVIEEPEEI